MARITYHDSASQEVQVEVGPQQPEVTIGRGQGNVIRLQYPSVSRQHAKIYFDGHRFIFEDLGSSNGCYVNGKRIQREAISSGDKLRCGEVPMDFTAEAAAPPPQPRGAASPAPQPPPHQPSSNGMRPPPPGGMRPPGNPPAGPPPSPGNYPPPPGALVPPPANYPPSPGAHMPPPGNYPPPPPSSQMPPPGNYPPPPGAQMPPPGGFPAPPGTAMPPRGSYAPPPGDAAPSYSSSFDRSLDAPGANAAAHEPAMPPPPRSARRDLPPLQEEPLPPAAYAHGVTPSASQRAYRAPMASDVPQDHDMAPAHASSSDYHDAAPYSDNDDQQDRLVVDALNPRTPRNQADTMMRGPRRTPAPPSRFGNRTGARSVAARPGMSPSPARSASDMNAVPSRSEPAPTTRGREAMGRGRGWGTGMPSRGARPEAPQRLAMRPQNSAVDTGTSGDAIDAVDRPPANENRHVPNVERDSHPELSPAPAPAALQEENFSDLFAEEDPPPPVDEDELFAPPPDLDLGFEDEVDTPEPSPDPTHHVDPAPSPSPTHDDGPDLDALHADLQRRDAHIEHLEAQLSELEAQVDALHQENQRLQQDLAESQEIGNEQGEAFKQVLRAKEEALAHKDEALEELRQRLDLLSSESESLRAAAEQNNAELEIEALRARATRLEEDLLQAERQNARLQARFDDFLEKQQDQEAHRNALAQDEGRIQALEEEVANLRLQAEERDRLDFQVIEERKQNAALRAELAQALNKIEAVEQGEQAMGELAQAIAALNMEREHLLAQVERLEEALDQANQHPSPTPASTSKAEERLAIWRDRFTVLLDQLEKLQAFMRAEPSDDGAVRLDEAAAEDFHSMTEVVKYCADQLASKPKERDH